MPDYNGRGGGIDFPAVCGRSFGLWRPRFIFGLSVGGESDKEISLLECVWLWRRFLCDKLYLGE
jgi:hypothetical protein